MYRIQRLWFEPRVGAFLLVGRLDGEQVRFAVTQAALDQYGWNCCMHEAFRRLHRGARDFGIAPVPMGRELSEGAPEPLDARSTSSEPGHVHAANTSAML